MASFAMQNQFIFRRKESSTKPRPCFYFIHGGGMMFGDRWHLIDFPLDVVAELDAIFVSVEYRLLPDHPYPAAVEDCFSGLKWISDHAAELGIDTDRILVGGISGGGALAAGLTLLWRDRQCSPLHGLILTCPMLDDRLLLPSASQYPDGNITKYVLSKAWEFCLGEGHQNKKDVSYYAAPGRATNLSGTPSTFIDVGSVECLRDECVAYASKLWVSGVQAELHVWPGGFHGFEEFAPKSTLAIVSRRAKMEWMKKMLQD